MRKKSVETVGVVEKYGNVPVFVQVFNSPPWNEDWAMLSASLRLTEIAGTPGFVGLKVVSEQRTVGFVMGYLKSFDVGGDFGTICTTTARGDGHFDDQLRLSNQTCTSSSFFQPFTVEAWTGVRISEPFAWLALETGYDFLPRFGFERPIWIDQQSPRQRHEVGPSFE